MNIPQDNDINMFCLQPSHNVPSSWTSMARWKRLGRHDARAGKKR